MQINEQIRDRNVILILEDGAKAGLMDTLSARRRAESLGLDLVVVSPSNGKDVAVAKIMDYGKLKYEQAKKEKKNKASSHSQTLKEMRFGYKTEDHDIQIKSNKVRDFLVKNHKVLISMELKGRDRNMVDQAKTKFSDIVVGFADIAKPSDIQVADNRLTVMLSPIS